MAAARGKPTDKAGGKQASEGDVPQIVVNVSAGPATDQNLGYEHRAARARYRDSEET